VTNESTPPAEMDAARDSIGPLTGARWLRRHLRLEDALLFGWLILVEPLLFPPATSAATRNGTDPFLGLDLIGLLAFVACLAARSRPDVVSGLVGKDDLLYAVGPLFGAIAFTLEDTADKLGLDGNLAILPIAAGIAVAVLTRRLVPPLSTAQRRALVTPFVLITSRFFGQFLAGLADIFDLRRLATSVTSQADATGAAFVVTIGIVAILIFYVMFVFAPRQVADREGTPRTWAVRFLLFLVSFTIGQTFGGFLSVG
jgi:hypothetical protein